MISSKYAVVLFFVIIIIKVLLIVWKKHHIIRSDYFTFKESKDCFRKYHRIFSVYWIHPLLNLIAVIGLNKVLWDAQKKELFLFCAL